MRNLDFENRLLGMQENMLNFAFSLTMNREEAKDLLQETTLKVLSNEDKYEENTNFKAWVLTIMKNIFINNYRKIVRDQTIMDYSDNNYYIDYPRESKFETPEENYTIKEITKCINSFSDDFKIPFSMHLSGYKYHEIAEKMNLPIGTVKSRIFFARQRLQESLKDYSY
jgi:RNA polymerase sigma-70 factor (ECF subfamily)